MGNARAAAEHMADAVMQSHGCVGDAEARQVGAHEQVLACLNVATVRDAHRQRPDDPPDAVERDRRDQRVDIARVTGLDAVSQGIDGGCGRQLRGQVERDFRVVNHDLREDRRVSSYRFASLDPVGRSEDRCHLRTGIGRRDRQQAPSSSDHDPLPHSHRATTPHGHDDIDQLLLGQDPSRLDRFLGNVLFHLRELSDQPAAERCSHPCGMRRRLQAGGADKEDTLPERRRLGTDAIKRPAPKEDAGRVECPAVTGRAGDPPSLPADRPRFPAVPRPGP